MIEVWIDSERMRIVVQTDYATHSIPMTAAQIGMYEDALQEQINGIEHHRPKQKPTANQH